MKRGEVKQSPQTKAGENRVQQINKNQKKEGNAWKVKKLDKNNNANENALRQCGSMGGRC